MRNNHSAGGGEIVEAYSSPAAAAARRDEREHGDGGNPTPSTKPPGARNSPPQPHPDTAGDDVVAVARCGCVELSRRGAGAREAGAMPKRELRRAPRFDRSKTAAAHALTGLRFISGAHADEGWAGVERRFDKLTEKQDGVLYGSQFGQCIGMKPMEEEAKGKKKEDKADKKKGEKRFAWCFWKREEMKSEKVVETEDGTEKRPDFAGVLFDALTRQQGIPGDGGITKAEMRSFWDRISDTSFDSRLQTFFDMVDKDADGRITVEEIKEIITLTASENKLLEIREQAAEYARLIMEAMDPAGLGYIELHQLEALLQLAPTQLDTTGNDSHLSRLLSPRPPEPNPLRRWCRRARYLLDDNWRRVWVLLLWLSACAALFAWKFVQYRRRYAFEVMGYCVCVAKGAAETLKLNMALILLPVCRNTLTWIRDLAAAARVIPFDDNLAFHKVVATGIAAGAALHAVPHLACDFPRLLRASDAAYAPLAPSFATARDRRPPNYWWFVRGTEGWTGLVMVALMAAAFTLATPWFRRGYLRRLWLRRPAALLRRMTPGFNAFWYSHHGFVVVYALLIVHGQCLYLTREWYRKTTWMYLAAPMAVYAGERLTRTVRSRARPVRILKAIEYPGNVLSLCFSTRPHEFRYRSGQYVFVKCPAVSPLQWHPFSITSAPQDDYVSIHIRVLGDWTGDLKKKFSPARSDNKAVREQVRVVYDCNDPMTNSRQLPEVLIDGPYGAPAQDYKQYDIVLLIGNGIGATPMVSIIKDIINTIKQQQQDGDDLEAGGGGVPSSSTPQRAYFYWVTREQGTFAWFRGVMDEVARTDRNGVIELHSHLTSVHKEGDARSAVVTMLQSISHAKHGVDVVTGSRAMAHFGRPNWRRVYQGIAQNHPDKRVGVFCSGAKVLTKELRKLAQEFSETTSTKFEFHKENF